MIAPGTPPLQPAGPSGTGHRHDRRRAAHEPGFSMLRTSLGARLVIVAGCSVVLWSAVWLVLS